MNGKEGGYEIERERGGVWGHGGGGGGGGWSSCRFNKGGLNASGWAGCGGLVAVSTRRGTVCYNNFKTFSMSHGQGGVYILRNFHKGHK